MYTGPLSFVFIIVIIVNSFIFFVFSSFSYIILSFFLHLFLFSFGGARQRAWPVASWMLGGFCCPLGMGLGSVRGVAFCRMHFAG